MLRRLLTPVTILTFLVFSNAATVLLAQEPSAGLSSGAPSVTQATANSSGPAPNAVQVAVPAGTPVRASGGGTVSAVGYDPDYGLFVLLRHPSGYETMYGHASRLIVVEGDDVQAGQVIALSGNSGRSTAPHLHFEIRRDRKSLDPLTFVKEGN